MQQTEQSSTIITNPNDVHNALGFFDYNEDLSISPEKLTKYEVGRSFYQLGKLYYDKADLVAAEEFFKKSLSCVEAPRDLFSMLKVYGFLIRIASERLDYEQAGKYIHAAELCVDQLTSNLGSLTADYFYHLGIVKNYKGDFCAAEQNFQLAYKKSQEENEPELLSKCLLALANNSFTQGDYDLAIDYLMKLEQLLSIINKAYLKGAMYLCAAKVRLYQGELTKAQENFKMANISFQDKKCWNMFGYILLGKGTAYKASGNYAKALELFELAHQSIDRNMFKRLSNLIEVEIQDVNDTSVDIYLDRSNRRVKEKHLGTIDFKHRFVLLEILFLLAKNPGSYFDKEQLAKSIWKDEYNPLIHDKLIYTSVSRLRKLIEPKSEDPNTSKRKYIIRGKDGYTFNPEVKTRFQMEGRVETEKMIGNVDLSSPV